MDHIHWKPGWIERTRDEKDRLTRAVHLQDEWIFEGGHSRTYAERVARADTLIWLDLPLHVRVRRVLWRTIRDLGRNRPDLPENCPERINMETVRFLHFIWTTRHSARSKIREIAETPGIRLAIHHLRSAGDVRKLLAQLDNSPKG